MADMHRKGRGRSAGAKGTRNVNAKLTEDAVRTIRALARSGTSSYALAAQFHIAYSTAKRVVSRKLWPHVN